MEPAEVKEAARKASQLCDERGTDIAKLALQFSCDHPDLATCIAGSANPANVRKWAEWLEAPIDHDLLGEILAIFEPVKNLGHESGLPENN
jgi:aryl-alcohol dehydrogenase-like predicted oxidoreductase